MDIKKDRQTIDVDDVNKDRELVETINRYPELFDHSKFHSVSGCPICQALARKERKLKI